MAVPPRARRRAAAAQPRVDLRHERVEEPPVERLGQRVARVVRLGGGERDLRERAAAAELLDAEPVEMAVCVA